VIDTGFARNNPDFDYSKIVWGKDYIDGDDDPLLNPGEGNEHGTHILGLMAALPNNGIGIDGLVPNAPIWAARAVGSGNWARALEDYVDYIKSKGQTRGLVNLSFDLTQVDADGTVSTRYEFTPEERAAIEKARQAGVVLVVAAGNGGTDDMSVLAQAAQEFDNIWSVAAVEYLEGSESFADGAIKTDYSGSGPKLAFSAIGGTSGKGVFSLVGNGFGVMAGTSVAAAEVTAKSALAWAANPNLNYAQLKEVLAETATDVGEAGYDELTGYGIINSTAAVELARTIEAEIYEPAPLFLPDDWSGSSSFTPSEWPVDSESRPVKGGTIGTISPESGSWKNTISDEVKRIGGMFGWQYAWNGSFPTLLGRSVGYSPVDITSAARVTGKVRRYEKGSVYWSPSSPRVAVTLWGELFREYQAMGEAQSFLGLPKKAEYDWNGGKRADFDGGYLYWNGYFTQAFKFNEMPAPYTPPIAPTPVPVPVEGSSATPAPEPIPTPAPVPTYLPGTGLVPAGAGDFLGAVHSSSGVVMHYYRNGYLVEQPGPGNRQYWYTNPTGRGFDPIGRVINKPAPLVDPLATTIMTNAVDLFDDPNRDQYNKTSGGFWDRTVGQVGGPSGQPVYYKFTLAGLRDISFKLSGMVADADLKLWNPVTKEFYSMVRSGSTVEEFRRILPGGDYYLVVEPGASSRLTSPETLFQIETNVRPADRDMARYKGLNSGIVYRLERGELRPFESPGRNASNLAHVVPDEDLKLFPTGDQISASEEEKRLNGLALTSGYDSILGDPTSDVRTAGTSPQGTTGSWQEYQNGSIHYSGRYGAVPLWFGLNQVYGQNGGSSGWLGFPTRREYDWLHGRRTDFEGGYLFFDPVDNSVKTYQVNEIPKPVVRNQPPTVSFPNFTMPKGASFTMGQYRNELEISDPDGDAIQIYRIQVDPTQVDMQGWSAEGQPLGTFLMPASELDNVRIYGSVVGTYPIQVSAFDGKNWSETHIFNLTVNPAVAATTVGEVASIGGSGGTGSSSSGGGTGGTWTGGSNGATEVPGPGIGKGGTTRTGESGSLDIALRASFSAYMESLNERPVIGKGGTGTGLTLNELISNWWYSPKRYTEFPESKNYGAGIYQGKPFFFKDWAQGRPNEYWLRDLDGKWHRSSSVTPLMNTFDWNNNAIQKDAELPELYKWDDGTWEIQSGDGYQFDDQKSSGLNTEIDESHLEIKTLSHNFSKALLAGSHTMTAGYLYEYGGPYNGSTSSHAGIDYAPSIVKPPAYAAVPGIVVSTHDYGSVGQFVTVESIDGRWWIYGHLTLDSKIKTGKFLSVGEEIGKLYPTTIDLATGKVIHEQHLHIEVNDVNNRNYVNGIPVGTKFETVKANTMSPLKAYWEYIIA